MLSIACKSLGAQVDLPLLRSPYSWVPLSLCCPPGLSQQLFISTHWQEETRSSSSLLLGGATSSTVHHDPILASSPVAPQASPGEDTSPFKSTFNLQDAGEKVVGSPSANTCQHEGAAAHGGQILPLMQVVLKSAPGW